jgi:hypothetical protein
MANAELADPCNRSPQAPAETRGRLLAWLGQGARDVVWALCSVPRARWPVAPPELLAATLGRWPAARHVRHLALYETYLGLPSVRVVLGDLPLDRLPPPGELERHAAAWDPEAAADAVPGLVRGLAEARFRMLQLLESAPEEAWERPVPPSLAPRHWPTACPAGLAWLVARSYQRELEHLNALWRLALYWDHGAPVPGPTPGRPLHPAHHMESY